MSSSYDIDGVLRKVVEGGFPKLYLDVYTKDQNIPCLVFRAAFEKSSKHLVCLDLKHLQK